MNYLAFREALHHFSVFSTRDILKQFPGFDSRRLVEWQDKGYLHKLINTWYLFADVPMDEPLRYRIANSLCRPSYVSLESALSHYSLIPEGVYTVQSITTKTTILYDTKVGSFNYRYVKPSLFFGYRAERDGGLPQLMAEPEKAVLDFLYLNGRIKGVADLESFRFNAREMADVLDWPKLDHYAAVFSSATLNKRLLWLKEIMTHAVAL